MTEVQSRLLELAEEIKSICQSEQLNYVLFGETAAYFEKHDGYEDMQYQLKLIMPYKDILKLEHYVNKNLSDTRVIESWRNNHKLQQMKFKYVDKTTLLFDGGSTEATIAPGIFVTIFPAREFEMPEKARACERYLQLVNKGQKDKAFRLVFFKSVYKVVRTETVKKAAMHRIRIDNTNYIHKGWLKHLTASDEKLAQFVMTEQDNAKKAYLSPRYVPKDILKKDKNRKDSCFVYVDDRANVIKLPKDLFTNTVELSFENKSFKAYSDSSVMLSALYGDNWEKRSQNAVPGTDRPAVIWDLDIDYQQYLDLIKDDAVSLEDIAKEKLEYNLWMGDFHNGPVNKAKHTFNRARRSVDRIDVWYQLRPERENLRKAYEKKDVKKLRDILKLYLKTTDRYFDDKIGFYIDEEIFNCAKLVWEEDYKANKKPKNYAGKVYKLVPEIYKTETPDEYFAKRGTKLIDNE